ncbi:class III poly(R)-hydroxyalkanoic acid synthase subunit PhaC [Alkalisalibacterium limincola]|uniref:Poly(3-hydroxyalkanoate) polymerase subunit PhaC n=1 Tax=Alkalisalibacterium limincola TaxID=2699169 RepID=A0A5C8L0L2_9GAMM|nr:class III poly(R)-hydroxyalkanoic acid synthase subunit PhaC [Alkalisalibacterium limincola]TXK65703.1 class III poly(R)-hydroxyalkanoic acid synthase subunit PhaC [Alkalisalibacterium limincola]
MYGPLNISPERMAFEIQTLNKKLSSSFEALRQVGDTSFGATGKEAVHSDGKAVLYRFRGESKPTAKVPLLIVYALVNRPYMVDLQHDRSLVKGLLAAGEDVYILDWGYPDGADRWMTLEDYIEGIIGGCVDHLCREHDVDAINVLGICQGGTFSLCYSALHPEKVRNLITMVTPVDFHTPDNMLSNWTRDLDVDVFVDALGNVPADLMNWCYLTLKPWRLFVQKYVGLTDILDDPAAIEDFLRMERWIFDSPDQAGEAFRQFIKQFYQGNGFVNGGITIGDREVDLKQVDMPILNVYATADHLVPPDASRPLKVLSGSDDYTELSFKGGHIGIYVSGRAQREVPASIHGWLSER